MSDLNPTVVQPLQVERMPLHGINLIEASAGTGKTYTITGLYLRLLLEAKHSIEEILVMTYTEAATKELRERVWSRLLEAKEAFSLGHSDDPLLQSLLGLFAEREEALRILDQALHGFDEAAIFTLHGYCKRALDDAAFESGLGFEVELVGDQKRLLQEIVEDFWRRKFSKISKLFARYALKYLLDPQSLTKNIEPHVAKSYLVLPEIIVVLDIEFLYQTVFQEAQKIWQTESKLITGLIQTNTHLNGNKYRKNSIIKWLSDLELFFSVAEVNFDLYENAHKFSQTVLNESLKKGKDTPPRHGFFEKMALLVEIEAQLNASLSQQLSNFKVELICYAREQLALRQKRRQQQSFDALLSNLQQALMAEQGEALSERLRLRYPVALIDEFQDTDPIQFDIFRRLYLEANLPVFWVGDPKQAIYSFRGADIFAYLQARQQADEQHTLQVNWRSQETLLSAVNALFKTVDQPFLYKEIEFPEVSAADKEANGLQLRGVSGNELHLWWLNDADNEGTDAKKSSLDKNSAEEKVSALIAAEIQTLLQLGQAGKALIEDRPLHGGDIAVLVRTHRQAAVVREQLLLRGISSVQQSPLSVFQSDGALELERLLLAISQPQRSGWVKAALVTDLMGCSALDLEQLQQDETLWEQRLNHFYECHHLWQSSGFMPMMRYWMQHDKVAQRLLRLPDGQRRLTNLRHLMELLQSSREASLNMEALLHYFHQRRGDDERQDDHQLRLENDENLVRIVTIHKSKGLEYGIVFCPFLWMSMGVKPRQNASTLDVTYHDENLQQRRLALQQKKDSVAVEKASGEALAEELRLFYVALTRAKYRCYLPWGKIAGMENSAAFYLLHQGQELKKTTADGFYSDLDNLAKEHDGLILSRPTLPENTRLIEQKKVVPLSEERRFRGKLYSNWRISSFSALFSHGAADVTESPDYDATESNWLRASSERLDRFGFPRGARAGQCLHYLFEHLDFSAPLDEAEALIEQTLQLFRFDALWQPVFTEWFGEMLQTPLNRESGLVLEHLTGEARLNELEFYYPMADFSMQRFQQILLDYGSDLEQRLAEQLNKRRMVQVCGFMKGFIDLVFESDGRFYLLDYKSNYLGEEYVDYRQEALQESMLQEGYVAQYLIYALALHRYLKCRLAGYDYEQNFGGVHYLFLRGMKADEVHEGEQTGLFFTRPSLALIDALDQFFAGE